MAADGDHFPSFHSVQQGGKRRLRYFGQNNPPIQPLGVRLAIVVLIDAVHCKVREDGRVVNQAAYLVVVDHLTGFSEAMATVFPGADVQQDIVHPTRHALQYAARKDDATLTTMLFLAGQAAQRTWTRRVPNGKRSWGSWLSILTTVSPPT